MNRGATVIGVGAMIFTATTVLVTARDALNRIADAKPAGQTTGNFWTMLLREEREGTRGTERKTA